MGTSDFCTVIFNNAAEPASAADDGITGDDIADGEVAGEAFAATLEVVGPLAGLLIDTGVLGSVITLDGVKDIAELKLGGALTTLATLPLPAFEVHPVISNAAAAMQTTSDGRLNDLVNMTVTITAQAW